MQHNAVLDGASNPTCEATTEQIYKLQNTQPIKGSAHLDWSSTPGGGGGGEGITDLTWTIIASIQGYPVLASLHAASSSSSLLQGIYITS